MAKDSKKGFMVKGVSADLKGADTKMGKKKSEGKKKHEGKKK